MAADLKSYDMVRICPAINYVEVGGGGGGEAGQGGRVCLFGFH